MALIQANNMKIVNRMEIIRFVERILGYAFYCY